MQCTAKEHDYAARMVRKEARVMFSVAGHPNIITLYGVCVEPGPQPNHSNHPNHRISHPSPGRGSLCLVLEIAEKGTLREVLDQAIRHF